MANINPPSSVTQLPKAFLENMVTLVTSGFGVVVALAWNEVIKVVVDNYITPYLGKDGSLASLLIYAVVMTVLAVLVTMQLSNLQKQVEHLQHLVAQKVLRKGRTSATTSTTLEE